jgi:hypothetical protein
LGQENPEPFFGSKVWDLHFYTILPLILGFTHKNINKTKTKGTEKGKVVVFMQ